MRIILLLLLLQVTDMFCLQYSSSISMFYESSLILYLCICFLFPKRKSLDFSIFNLAWFWECYIHRKVKIGWAIKVKLLYSQIQFETHLCNVRMFEKYLSMLHLCFFKHCISNSRVYSNSEKTSTVFLKPAMIPEEKEKKYSV